RVAFGPGTPERITVRDQDDLPWIDLHREPSATLTLRLPERLAENAVVEAREQRGGESVVVGRQKWPTDSSGVATLAQLDRVEWSRAGRGPQDLFRMLFTRPFGPSAFAAYQAMIASAPPQVIGVSRDDGERMHALLAHTASVT